MVFECEVCGRDVDPREFTDESNPHCRHCGAEYLLTYKCLGIAVLDEHGEIDTEPQHP